MCAIIDLNVVGDVFKRNRSPAEEQFFDWLEGPGARLVIGGKLWKEELRRNGNFAAWAQEGLRAGRVKEFPENAVNEESDVVSAEGLCKSDDPHIIGLARVSRARLLYSYDKDLHDDFTNRHLISNPRGKVYPRGDSDNASKQRRRLLTRSHLCPNR